MSISKSLIECQTEPVEVVFRITRWFRQAQPDIGFRDALMLYSLK